MVANEIHSRISELIIACEVVRDADQCSRCPLKGDCLEDCTFEHIAYKVKVDAIGRLICMADRITEDEEELNKTEEQRRWEAEAEYWNLRRCDPYGE